MTKNEIQEQRMRGYFIDATRTILKGEGLKAVSVRNIAREAGYSYATLYNYFKDVKDLVFECVCDFQEECSEYVSRMTRDEAPGIRRIRAISIAYMKYFVEYPGIFELFFIEKPTDLATRQPTVARINTFLDRLCEEDWELEIQRGLLSEDKRQELARQLKYLTTGMLVFYLHRREDIEYKEFFNNAQRQFSALFAETI